MKKILENYLQLLYNPLLKLQSKDWKGHNLAVEKDDRPNWIGQCMSFECDRAKINCLRKLRDQAAMNPQYKNRIDRFIDAITDTYNPTDKPGMVPQVQYENLQEQQSITFKVKDFNELTPDELYLYSESLKWSETKANFPKNKEIGPDVLKDVVNKDRKYISKVSAIVAEFKEQPIGIIIASIDNEVSLGYIWGLYIIKDFRRGSTATSLISKAIKHLKENSVKEIQMIIKGGNENALRFYMKMDFKIKEYVLRLNGSKYTDNRYSSPHSRFLV